MLEGTVSVGGCDYTIIKLLGKGKGGYSYLADGGGRQVVLKQIHHEPCAYYQFGDKLASELRDYEKLRALGVPMPALLDVDHAQERIVKEYIAGDTIYQLVLRDEMREDYFAQMRALCARLYPAHTNIDYFPTNFVVRDDLLWYVDYECNDYMDEWNFENWGVKYWSKTPEFLQYAAEHP